MTWSVGEGLRNWEGLWVQEGAGLCKASTLKTDYFVLYTPEPRSPPRCHYCTFPCGCALDGHLDMWDMQSPQKPGLESPSVTDLKSVSNLPYASDLSW